ncbi:MAG: hypothetical protein OES09_11460 [Gammaproteobacteria bacterium]|nr:hypothetical protein [Gammaproteobacteria bacterium]
MSVSADKLITGVNVKEFFKDSVVDALKNQHVDACESTVFYVVNLLCHFARVDRLFEWTSEGFTLQPLALLYRDAVEATSSAHKIRALRRLGDVSLFISGILTGSLERKPVDINYYIAMGGNAYRSLSDNVLEDDHGRGWGEVFHELAEKFSVFVEVLNEVGDRSELDSDQDILRLYDEWTRNNSPRAAMKLRRLGINVSADATSQSRH